MFDLLYLNGQPLINKSTKFRKRNLKACIKGIQGRIEFVTEFEALTAMDVRKRMEDIMAARGEGLVMKHPDASYILNGRSKDWIKASIVSWSRACTNCCRRSNLSTWLVSYRISASLCGEFEQDNMGETVDALVVGAPLFLPHEAVLISMVLLSWKLRIRKAWGRYINS